MLQWFGMGFFAKTSRSIFASKLKKSHRRRQPSSQSDHAEGKKKALKNML